MINNTFHQCLVNGTKILIASLFAAFNGQNKYSDYDALRHLSCYDFLDRLNNMKSVHMNLANNIEPNGKAILQRPRSVSVKGRRKLVRGKKCNSASKISSRKICQFDVNKFA